jgi:hypothetical protein
MVDEVARLAEAVIREIAERAYSRGGAGHVDET